MRRMFLLVCCLSLTACASFQSKVNQMAIGMDKSSVRNLLGEDYQNKAAKVDPEKNVLEVWSYYDEDTKETYYVYFKKTASLNGATAGCSLTSRNSTYPKSTRSKTRFVYN